jgi:hypothetical protein
MEARGNDIRYPKQCAIFVFLETTQIVMFLPSL